MVKKKNDDFVGIGLELRVLSTDDGCTTVSSSDPAYAISNHGIVGGNIDRFIVDQQGFNTLKYAQVCMDVCVFLSGSNSTHWFGQNFPPSPSSPSTRAARAARALSRQISCPAIAVAVLETTMTIEMLLVVALLMLLLLLSPKPAWASAIK